MRVVAAFLRVFTPKLAKSIATLQTKTPSALAGRFVDAQKTQARCRLRLFGAACAEALAEAIDTAAGVGNFLLAGIERVAVRADVEMDIFAERRAGLEGITARAIGVDFSVFRMDIGFHFGSPTLVGRRHPITCRIPRRKRGRAYYQNFARWQDNHQIAVDGLRSVAPSLLHCRPIFSPDNVTVTTILRVAVPGPLRQLFDYLPPVTGGLLPAHGAADTLRPGIRLRVPFGRRQVVGLLIAVVDHSEWPLDQLKHATEVLDVEPIFTPALLDLLSWASDYYLYPLGECVVQALPGLLRGGNSATAVEQRWRLTVAGLALPDGALRRAPQQAKALTALQQEPALGTQSLAERGVTAATLRALVAKGLIERFEQPTTAVTQLPPIVTESAPTLSSEQQAAVDSIAQSFGRYGAHLLDGVTGSGKTEVYLQLLAQVIACGKQALVLVPEIGLTPQTLARFQRRLGTPIAVLHSGLNDSERLQAWRLARSGVAGVVLGTRSAVFADFNPASGAGLGLIIIDEEHDSSFKQQDGFRYSARDVAIKRAAELGIPIVLGSATPSLESLHNALSGKYRHLLLHERAGGAAHPRVDLLDIRRAPLRDGLAPAVIDAIGATVKRNEQVLVFLNRRGFAPTLLCHDCGWIAGCDHCDTRLTVHAGDRRLRCHHCGFSRALPSTCPQCKSARLDFRGPGTERLELALTQLFPHTPVVRIDRDTTQRKHALRDKLATVREGEPCILVGTQMLAKGHHFPDVTLVVMVDIDGALFSADLRGPERMAQVLTQVSGRAGRAQKPGRVLVQTHYPEHPLIAGLVRDGYAAFARELLAERRLLGAPPFAYFALIRADARDLSAAEQLLAALRAQLNTPHLTAIGPLPAPLTRRAGLFRAQLILSAPQRPPLHRALHQLLEHADTLPFARQVRWSIDVDPIDFS